MTLRTHDPCVLNEEVDISVVKKKQQKNGLPAGITAISYRDMSARKGYTFNPAVLTATLVTNPSMYGKPFEHSF